MNDYASVIFYTIAMCKTDYGGGGGGGGENIPKIDYVSDQNI